MNTCLVCYKYQVSFFVSIISFSSWVLAHQNRGKLIYETFVKDYVVFSHVVKDKLLFILQTVLKSKTLKKMSKRFMTPILYGFILCCYVVQPVVKRLCGLLNYLKVMKKCAPIRLKKLIWIYGVQQPDLFKTFKEIWASHQFEFVEGFLKT